MARILVSLLLVAACSAAPVPVSSGRPSRGPATAHGGTGSKTYVCKRRQGCTVRVNGAPYTVVYGGYAPIVCGVGVVVVGCGCGFYAPASCSCGEVFVPAPSCGVSCAPASCAPASCGAAPSCGAPSCGAPPSSCGGCGSSCG